MENLTEEMIDSESAGRRLDELVARHVFNYSFDPGLQDENTGFWYPPDWNDKYKKWPSVHFYENQIEQPSSCWEFVPHYSTTWDGAGLVVDHLHKHGWDIDMSQGQDDPPFHPCEASVMRPDWKIDDRFYSNAETLPLAVCRAALKAVLQGK